MRRDDEHTLQRRILDTVRDAGYVLLDPIETDDPDAMLLDLISSCFEPVTHFRNPMVMDLRPQRGMDPTSYAGAARVALHTDRAYVPRPPRYIVMMCIVPDTDGGEPEIADGAAALAMLDETMIRDLRESEFPFLEAAGSERVGFTGPILSESSNGRDDIRFRRDLLPAHAGTAVTELGRALRRCTMRIDVRPGSVWIVDNHRVLHGRTELRNGVDSKRHLKRMYAEDR
jgi:hypothetical protein